MLDAPATTATTAAKAHASGGFPPFKFETFPSQFFWLAITLAVLFVVLWRYAGPRIKQTLTDRRGMIQKEFDAAQENRRRAEAATVAYETPLYEAREQARAMNEQSREHAAQEVKKAEAAASASAERATADAEARLARVREEAKTHIANAARDAAIEIVARLTGERVSGAEAEAAVRAAQEA
jgi:F-type H+-transporting ATPase subunit b